MANTIIVYMNKGDEATFDIPCSPENLGGFFPAVGSDFKNGFRVTDTDAGIITKTHTDKVAIDYKHLSYGNNTIIFQSYSGESVNIVIGNVIPHDHASIRTGGPAYATYFSETP